MSGPSARCIIIWDCFNVASALGAIHLSPNFASTWAGLRLAFLVWGLGLLGFLDLEV